MSDALSVRSIYAESVRVWVSRFWVLTLLALGLEAPLVIVEVVVHLGAGLKIDTTAGLAVSAASVPIALYGSLSHHFLSGLLERLVGAEREGHEAPGLAAVLHDLPWLRLLGADVTMTVLVVVGYAALIIPGVIIATWLTPLLVIVNLERHTVRQSMVRSYQLVRGHFWRVLVVGFVALAVVQALVSVAGGLAESMSDSHTVSALASAVPSTLLMPIAALPIVVLTFDLVGLDRQARSGAGTSPS